MLTNLPSESKYLELTIFFRMSHLLAEALAKMMRREQSLSISGSNIFTAVCKLWQAFFPVVRV